VIEDRRTILAAGVVTLTVQRSRIVDHEEHLQQLLERHDRGIEGDAHDLGMPRVAAADLLVGRVRAAPAHVTRLDGENALHAVVYGLQAPEAAARQRGDCLSGRRCPGIQVNCSNASGVSDTERAV
jgi:hypothetical protein